MDRHVHQILFFSDIITDSINDLMARKDWKPEELASDYVHKILVLIKLPSNILIHPRDWKSPLQGARKTLINILPGALKAFWNLEEIEIISQFRILFEQHQDTIYSDYSQNKEKPTHHPCLNSAYANTVHILKEIIMIWIMDLKKWYPTTHPTGELSFGYSLGITIFKSMI